MKTHEAVVKREVHRKVYTVSRYWHREGYEIYDDTELVDTETLWSGDLDSPILEGGDELYLTDLDEIVVINKVIRSTDNKHIYFAKNRYIEDELSKESLAKAEEEKARKDKEAQDNVDEIKSTEPVEEKIDEAKLNWFQKLFKNK